MPDLIAAVATGAVRSAIGIIRLSGDGAIECADRLFQAKSGVKMADAPSNKLIFGRIHALDGALLDTGMCTVSRAPRSYTGEDTAELQCHGSPAALGSILAELFKSGARQALPGEFTKRAFLNGKLDLTQAEAVVDLIDADTESSARNAAGQLGGAVARRSGKVYSNLLDIAAHFHAVVDWPDEDIEDFRLADYLGTLDSAEKALSELLDTFERGKIMRGGAVTAIVGRPNVGKSSLLNALLGFDRAIVTDIPGTTRDTVEETCVLGGVKLRLTDTAGLRDTGDAVERIGVERSYDAMERAMLIFAVLDASEHVIGEDLEIIKKAALQAPTAIVLNKSDLPRKAVLPPELEGIPAVSLSAVTGEGIGGLADIVTALLPGVPEAPTGEILTNARQAGEVRAALESVRSARAAMLDGVTPDAVLTEIESAMEALGRLTGRTLASDVTDRIFHRFCVGK